MAKMSKDKGKRFERQVAKMLNSLFPRANARRGVQYAGGKDSPDVVHELGGLHVECKATERLRIYDALSQASRDADDNIPSVVFKRNHKPVVFCIYLEDLPRLIMEGHKWL